LLRITGYGRQVQLPIVRGIGELLIPWDLESMTDHPLTRRIIYRGLKIDLELRRVPLRDGTTAEREVVLHRGAVALVPMVDPDHVCLVRNHRYAVDRTLLEVPAGTIDPGEDPDQTAGRELLEETGYQAGRLRRIREWYVSPGVMNERMYLYLCEDLRPGPTEHQLDEQLQVVVLPWEEAVALAEDGQIEDAKTLLALMICDRLRRREAGGGAP
jgi:ADP-ribose pyrophosphatase